MPNKHHDLDLLVHLWSAAAFIARTLIRARLMVAGEFLPTSQLRAWDLPDARSVLTPLQLLELAQDKMRETKDEFGICDSGASLSPSWDEEGELGELRTQVSLFFQHPYQLQGPIAMLKEGEPVDWSGIVQWDVLPDLRSAVDKVKLLVQAERAKATKPRSAKRSTESGEARTKIVSTLTKHHKYADGSCLNLEPIGNNELARQAEVDQATTSAFFKSEFGCHAKYRETCKDRALLVIALKLWNNEYAPRLLVDRIMPEQGDEEREEDLD